MGLISGIRLIRIDENKSVTQVPFRWVNKNPFESIYFAVLSMAAELSTAAPVIMALKGLEANVAFIIVGLKADFSKKAKSRVIFTCEDYLAINDAISQLSEPGDTASITAETIGRDVNGEEVARFYFTWSFRVR
ncbi:MAG: DUF4442 domain-containing protein [Gammaproteobacteria bacterium]|nr:DUF4442 domain-containing protein [Gammaproteobacteria bacterium]NNJ50974.1 thioesterase [Gammaproteobacteria bacterium]